jgi:hypothetical protein
MLSSAGFARLARMASVVIRPALLVSGQPPDNDPDGSDLATLRGAPRVAFGVARNERLTLPVRQGSAEAAAAAFGG